eukprot:gene18181-24617_t
MVSFANSSTATMDGKTQTAWYHHPAMQPPNQPYLTTNTHFHSDVVSRETLDNMEPYNSSACGKRHMATPTTTYRPSGTPPGDFTGTRTNLSESKYFPVDPESRSMTPSHAETLSRAAMIASWDSEYSDMYVEKSPLQYRGYSTLGRK